MKQRLGFAFMRLGGTVRSILLHSGWLALFVFLAFNSRSAQAVDLMEVYRIAQEQDPAFQSASYKHQASPETLKQAYSELLPAATASGEYINTRQEIISSEASVYGDGTSNFATNQYTLTLTQPIFQLSSIVRVSQATAEVSQADAEFEAAKQDLRLRVAELYVGALAAQDKLAFARAEQAAIRSHFELTQARHGMGLAPITDLHDAKARLATVTADLIDAENELADAFEALAEVTGREIETLARLKDEAMLTDTDIGPGAVNGKKSGEEKTGEEKTGEEKTGEEKSGGEKTGGVGPADNPSARMSAPDDSTASGAGNDAPGKTEHEPGEGGMRAARPEPQGIDPWIDAALKQNIELDVLRQAVEVSEQEVKRQKTGHFPTLQLVGRLNRQDTEGSLFGGGSDVETSDVTVQAKLPIFEGGYVLSRTREAYKLLKAAKQDLEKQVRAVRRETRAAFLGVNSAIKRVEALRQSMISNQLALEAKEEGYKSGLFTGLMVLDAERDLYLAKQGYAQARYDYIVNSLRLKKAVGILKEEDLEAVNMWLQ